VAVMLSSMSTRYRNAAAARRFAARVLMDRAQEQGADSVAAARALGALSKHLEVDEERKRSRSDSTLTGEIGGDLVDYLRARIVEVRADLAAARAAGSHQAATAGVRVELKMRRELQAELDKRDPLDGLTPEQFAARLGGELRDWPDQYLELAIAEYETRHRVRASWLRVIEGGA